MEAVTNRGSRVTDKSLDRFADLMATRRMIERTCLAASIERGGAVWEAEIVASMHLLSRATGRRRRSGKCSTGAFTFL